ncbi:MAG: hypothetical protein ACE5I1_18740 [bacterium]
MIFLGNYAFDGPHRSIDDVKDFPGVFAIVCERDEKFQLLDVDESDAVRSSIESHAREDCWEENCEDGELAYLAYYTGRLPKSKRQDIVREIRSQYTVICG